MWALRLKKLRFSSNQLNAEGAGNVEALDEPVVIYEQGVVQQLSSKR
jgi:hypothetical protein